jgi:hypothetical protein
MNKPTKKKGKRVNLLKYSERLKDQKGVTIVLVAVLMVVLIGFMALAIDVGYLMVTRNELHNIADGAALAACGELGAIYQSLSPQAQIDYVCGGEDLSAIIAKAVDVGQNNRAGGLQGIAIREDDVIIGTWDGTSLTQTLDQPDAVRVIARREGADGEVGFVNGPITTFFARVLGINTLDVSKSATAALTGQSTTEPGELELPVGISSYFFQAGNKCNESIVFNPTNDPDSCAGWNSYDISPPNDNLLRQILNGNVLSPGTTAGETEFNFIGGNLSNPTFDALLLLFMRKGYDIDANGNPVLTTEGGNPVSGHLGDGYPGTVPMTYDDGSRAYYPDSNQNPTPRNLHRWETTVAVYGWDTCANPNTTIPVVGYAKIILTDVEDAPQKRIVGEIICDVFSDEPTRGGGGEYGVKGTIAGLVQ